MLKGFKKKKQKKAAKGVTFLFHCCVFLNERKCLLNLKYVLLQIVYVHKHLLRIVVANYVSTYLYIKSKWFRQNVIDPVRFREWNHCVCHVSKYDNRTLWRRRSRNQNWRLVGKIWTKLYLKSSYRWKNTEMDKCLKCC